jgi:glutaminase
MRHDLDYAQILAEISHEILPFRGEGKVADYIPELANISPDKYGVCIYCLDGKMYKIGDSDEKFSIQSISKVFSLSLAFSILDDEIWKRVEVEPSGNPFNSLLQLEYEKGIPRNPFINAGAIVVADILVSQLAHPKQNFLEFVRKIAGNPFIDYNPKVAHSERDWGFRNRSLANFLKSFGNLHNDVEQVLDFYFYQCSIEMTCEELAKAFLIYANHGDLPDTAEVILSTSQIKRINALMQTCGFYDEAGEFTFKVGLPGKSGVGGGMVAIYPQRYSIAVWSPKLNEKGNSVLGLRTLESFTSKTGASIF